MHISENRLEGSLLDTDLKEVLDECHAHLVTATLLINSGAEKAVLEIRAGAVDSVDYKGLKKSEALAKLHELKTGEFELAQKLPDLTGKLGTAASLETETDEISIVKLMQLCEDNALSCSVTATTDDVTAVIRYKAGDIDGVDWNGERDDDRIVDLVKLEKARIRVEAPPLKFGILSWPTVRDDPTPAFIPIQEMAKGRLDAKATATKKKIKKTAKAEAKTKTTSDAKAKAKPKAKAKAKPKAEDKNKDKDKDKPKAAKKAVAVEGLPPRPGETSGAVVLFGLLLGLVAVAAVLVFALKFLLGGG